MQEEIREFLKGNTTLVVAILCIFVALAVLIPRLAYFAVALPVIVLALSILSHIRVKPIAPWLVDSYEATMDLTDREGKRAYVKRKMRIRAQQSYLDSFVHTDIFADGRLGNCEVKPGKIIEEYQDVGRTLVKHKLDRPFKRGEMTECEISYPMYDSFTRPAEYFNVSISKPTRKVSLRIIFPQGRLCKTFQVQNFQGGTSSWVEDQPTLQEVDGRQELFWEKNKPLYLTSYRVLWTW